MKNYVAIGFTLLVCHGLHAQNWNGFNKNYRYNYTFDNSTLISNVLFVTSTVQAGPDTVYKTNLIATPCQNGCPTITATVNGSVITVPPNDIIIPFQPQFLQRTIRKLSNGSVAFADTADFLILPNCVLNQTWLFDTASGKSATCVALGTKMIFSISDSVKTIVIGNTDTLLLSKSFGIIQFPFPYGQNKYYRLVGIENAASYGPAALYGLKVPNFWDMYNYNVGDQFYQVDEYCDLSYGFGGALGQGFTRWFAITGKLSSAAGYTYQVQGLNKGYNTISGTGGCVQAPVTASPITRLIYRNDSTGPENLMYPGALVANLFSNSYNYNRVDVLTSTLNVNSGMAEPFNLSEFIIDVNNNFTKQTNVFSGLYPQQVNGKEYLIPYTANLPGVTQYVCTESIGMVEVEEGFFEHGNSFKTASAVKGSDTLYGPMPRYDVFAGVRTYSSESGTASFYPNPASQKLKFNLKQDTEIEVYDNAGGKVKRALINENGEMTVSDLPQGLYLVRMKTDRQTFNEKLIISR